MFLKTSMLSVGSTLIVIGTIFLVAVVVCDIHDSRATIPYRIREILLSVLILIGAGLAIGGYLIA